MNFNKYKIYSVEDLMKYFSQNMKYGFKYRHKIFTDDKTDFQLQMDKFYKLRLKDDFLKSGYGVCWDFCELEREFFLSKNIEHCCYFIESFINRQEGGPTHTFALFKENGCWYWFEFAWLYYRGIHKYKTKHEALKDILNKFQNFYDRKLYNINLYQTKRVNKRMDTYEFVEYCLNQKIIDVSEL